MTPLPASQLAQQGVAVLQLDDSSLNQQLYDGFMQHADATDVKKTHLFHGRYENIYLTPEQVPALTALRREVHRHAAAILQHEHFQSGCWFNHMPPQAVTSRHNHDDGFELLSAVYYVRVPPRSGELILYTDPVQCLTPAAGQLVFFPPSLDHEVSVNQSAHHRLSIAFNIGPPRNPQL